MVVQGSFLKGTWLQLSSVSSGSENWLKSGNWMRNHDFSFWQLTSAFSECALNIFCLSQEKPLLSAHLSHYFATDPNGSGPHSHHCGFGAHHAMTSTFTLTPSVKPGLLFQNSAMLINIRDSLIAASPGLWWCILTR